MAAGPAVLNDRTLSFTGAGEVSVMASQPGDGNWEPAPDVVRTFTVTDPPVLTGGPVRVREGGRGRFFLRLDRSEAPVVVQVQRQDGDGTLDVQAGATRAPGVELEHVWQAVVLGAAEDDNAGSERAVFRLSAAGLPIQFIKQSPWTTTGRRISRLARRFSKPKACETPIRCWTASTRPARTTATRSGPRSRRHRWWWTSAT